jgi:hypothetical protein
MSASFTRHRYELPLLAVFFALALVELFVVHLLVAMWSSTAALVLTTLTVIGLVPLALMMHGLATWPTMIEGTGVRVRHGRRGEIFVPFTQIVSSEDVALRSEERGAHVFRATILAHPNIMMRLAEPLPHKRRKLESIAMRLDEPAAFRAALDACLRGAPDETGRRDQPALP